MIRITPNVPFPSLVTGIGPVAISKRNGIWQIGLDVKDLVPLTGPFDPATKFFLIYDTNTGSFVNGSIAALGGSIASIVYVIDGGGVVLTPGIKGDLEIPFACQILRATLLADQVGSIVVDVWSDVFGNYPPTVADSITGAAPPTIVGATKSQDTTLTGWTTAVAAGNTLRFNVNSVATIQRVTLSLEVQKI